MLHSKVYSLIKLTLFIRLFLLLNLFIPVFVVSSSSGAFAAAPVSDLEKNILTLPSDQTENRKKPVKKLLLVGDSFMQGYGPSFKALLSKRGITVIDASKPSTGLVIKSNHDWPQRLSWLLDKHSPELVICSMGANDTQGMYVGKKVLAFGKEEWRKEYGERVRYLSGLARQKGAEFVWMGLPRMRSPVYNKNVTVVNEVSRGVMEENGGHFISTYNILSDDDFSSGQSSGRKASLRHSDGIHYSMKGYQMVTNAVIQQLVKMNELSP